MAEAAPLSLAHDHVRKAAEEAQQVHLNESAEHHEHAATEFARASRGTSDSEALRILKLLEERHQKLADIIKNHDPPVELESASTESKQQDPSVSRHDFAEKTASPPAQSKSTTNALAAARFGSQTRDSSPSLARDIASRRGIPQPNRNPPSAAAKARARQLSPEAHRPSRHGPPPPKIPPSIVDSQSLSAARKAKKREDDAAFSNFYSNITTGTMSKLSSVLAYAGLPLTAEDVQAEQKQKSNKKTVSASNDPDVKKIFSKAALDAIEDDHRQRGMQGQMFGPNESFYIVQTGGGTYSYADMAKAQQGQLGGIDEDDEEAFVDAREAQAPSSPRHSRYSSQSGARGSFGKNRTHEELELENTTLKATLEQLATRLADFETHAQDASMAALTQSMASLGPPAGQQGGSDPAMTQRLEQLERQLEQQAEERDKLQNLAAKQEKTLKMYKNKWDDLKKSAKERQQVKREKGGKAGEETGAGPEAEAS